MKTKILKHERIKNTVTKKKTNLNYKQYVNPNSKKKNNKSNNPNPSTPNHLNSSSDPAQRQRRCLRPVEGPQTGSDVTRRLRLRSDVTRRPHEPPFVRAYYAALRRVLHRAATARGAVHYGGGGGTTAACVGVFILGGVWDGLVLFRVGFVVDGIFTFY